MKTATGVKKWITCGREVSPESSLGKKDPSEKVYGSSSQRVSEETRVGWGMNRDNT